ncbi:hypothetical protein [Natronorubrum sp. DTA28]|uniref:hypothetical protein n=1 Tax=Natronorubrum sp. DTA28 TaxID=3447019 RepID=UPI003F86AF45
MRTSRSVAFLVLVAIVGLTVAPIASGAVVGTLTDDSDSEGESSDEVNTDVSAFMQSVATDTDRSVESGMHDSRFEAADDDRRADIVLERTADLEDRHADLEAEREELEERKDDLHRGEYQARMAQVTVEIQSLERAIDRTEQQATETDVDDERLDERLGELRENAATLSGPEVAEIARGLGGPDGTPGGGPPAHASAGNQSNGALDQGNGSPPDHAGPGNQSDTGSQGQGNASPPGQADPGDQSDDGNPGQGNASPPEQSSSDDRTDDEAQAGDEAQADDENPGQGASPDRGTDVDRETGSPPDHSESDGQTDGEDAEQGDEPPSNEGDSGNQTNTGSPGQGNANPPGHAGAGN